MTNRCLSLPLIKCNVETASNSSTSNFEYKICTSIAEVDPVLWTSLAPPENLFFNIDYLLALENSVDHHVKFRYLVIEKDKMPAGVAVFQLIKFSGSNVENETPEEGHFIKAYAARLFKGLLVKIVNRLSLNLLVCGNTFVTGEYGLFFNDKESTSAEIPDFLEEGIQKIMLADNTEKISGILIKDYYKESSKPFSPLKDRGYLEFEVNPNMILDLDESWNDFDDYLAAMTSKYRTRMKKAIKRSADIEARELQVEDIQRELARIGYLYDQVIDASAFKLTKLEPDYMIQLKRALKEKFKVIGFYKSEQLVSYISYYADKEDLVAGFMGMEKDLNKAHDLYLNVLLKLVEEGIKINVKKVTFGRTAMEIKSSVGALPHQMYLYTKHNSPWINGIIKRVVKMLAKDPEWTLRSPFKDQ